MSWLGSVFGGSGGGSSGQAVQAANTSSGGAYGGAIIGSLTGFGSYAWEKSASTKAAKKAFKRNLWLQNTAYQRAAADLEAAGLNRMLAYSQGGASGPGAPMAATPNLDIARDIESGVSSARGMKMVKDEAAKLAAERDTAETQAKAAKHIESQESSNAITAANQAAESNQWIDRWNMDRDEQYWLNREREANVLSSAKSRDLMDAQRRGHDIQNRIHDVDARWLETEWGEALRRLERGSQFLNNAPNFPRVRGSRKSREMEETFREGYRSGGRWSERTTRSRRSE